MPWYRTHTAPLQKLKFAVSGTNMISMIFIIFMLIFASYQVQLYLVFNVNFIKLLYNRNYKKIKNKLTLIVYYY